MRRGKSARYARFLLVLAERNEAMEAVNLSLKILSDLNETDSAFRVLFFTRRIEPSRKVQILSSVLGDRLHPIALEFLALLGEKHEHGLLGATASEYETIYMQRANRVFVTAVTSERLETGEYGEIHDRLESALKKRVDMKKEVDSRMLGGIKLRIGNTFLDGSVSTRLEKLKSTLV